MRLAKLGLELPHSRAHELDDPSTFSADHVVVLQARMEMFIQHAVPIEFLLAHETTLFEQVQASVDGSPRDLESFTAHLLVEPVCVDVLMAREDLFEQRETLRGHPEAAVTYVGAETVEFAVGAHLLV